jgi:hypothetical protein
MAVGLLGMGIAISGQLAAQKKLGKVTEISS